MQNYPAIQYIFKEYVPLVGTLATDDEAALPAAFLGNDTPSSARTGAAAWMVAEVEDTSSDALSEPPTT